MGKTKYHFFMLCEGASSLWFPCAVKHFYCLASGFNSSNFKILILVFPSCNLLLVLSMYVVQYTGNFDGAPPKL